MVPLLRLSLFHDVEAQYVFGALHRFYEKRGARVVSGSETPRRFVLHQREQHWCVLDSARAWDWKEARDAQVFVSRELGVAGLLIFRYESYWGYELYRNGRVMDRFVQCPPEDSPVGWFPGETALGDPAALVECFPELSLLDVGPYLVQRPPYGPGFERFFELNVPVRPGDRFNRFDKLAVVDFLNLLGIKTTWRDDRWDFGAEVFRSLAVQFPA